MEPRTAPPVWDRQAELDHFTALAAAGSENRDRDTRLWDSRAEAWEQARITGRKGEDRVRRTVAYLEQRGVLRPEYRVADIGCGPGQFAVAFARRTAWVTGLDLSPRMIHYGQARAQREGVENLALQVCDFASLDVQAAGLAGAFDLVFSSLTPAVHDGAGLQKVMAMSRAYCCHITHLRRDNSLLRQIQAELFPQLPAPAQQGRWFYTLFNLLLLEGYLPEASYDQRQETRRFAPSLDAAGALLAQLLPPEGCSAARQQQVLAWLEAHAEEDGLLTETRSACYGRILWDVRTRLRPSNGTGGSSWQGICF